LFFLLLKKHGIIFSINDAKGKKKMKKVCIGVLAHVDSGKTTLSEALLYLSGNIRKLGRVDDKNAFFDTYALERQRGITIFSKQAELKLKETQITLLDTPGHIDFSAEMERTLQVLDYAILLISGADGIQSHTETLWKLLKRYKIPVFLFINKMDQPNTKKNVLLEECKNRLDSNCIEFGIETEEFLENIAMCEESLLDRYLENGTIEKKEIVRLIQERKLFPCYFGSALKLFGVEELLNGIDSYTIQPDYPSDFAARVFKITRDSQGNRLTFLKITGGSLKVRAMIGTEKVNQIRIYSGTRYETVNEATAGTICAVTGLMETVPGEGLGNASTSISIEPVLEPIFTYKIEFPEGCDIHAMLQKLKLLEEEEPQLHIVWKEQLEEVQVQIMGEVQIEILESLIKERFGMEVHFGTGAIVYKETIKRAVEGVGHFEPLRHYAEVHLYMEPLLKGSGLIFDTNVKEEELDRNWQRLILTHLEEKTHLGVLTGSPITDMKITLVSGKAHLKHTEGGDFRQATYRAVRQGLMQAESVLLEPYYSYRLEIPNEMVGRAMTDLERMSGSFEIPKLFGETAVLEGSAPVATMQNYQKEVIAYTRGRGRLSCVLNGYEPCHNQEEVIQAIGYDAEADLENPSGSVFCSHGAGFYVGWEEVKDYMHLEAYQRQEKREIEKETKVDEETDKKGIKEKKESVVLSAQEEKELEEIFNRTYGSNKKNRQAAGGNVKIKRKETQPQKKEEIEEYLLVDGYNIIFAWEELKELAKENIDSARNRLIDILCNYQGFKKCHLILVFDAYKVTGYTGEMQKYHNINVVYTREAETADQYIEKLAYKIGTQSHVTVATSDSLVQLIIMGQGCIRMSAAELKEEVEKVNQQIRKEYLEQVPKKKQYLFDGVETEIKEQIEQARLGKKNL